MRWAGEGAERERGGREAELLLATLVEVMGKGPGGDRRTCSLASVAVGSGRQLDSSRKNDIKGPRSNCHSAVHVPAKPTASIFSCLS